MATIIPAILEETLENFNDKVFQIERVPGVERIQVDFGDGQFVSHKTLPVKQIDPLNPAYVWEAHLMIQQPHNFLDYQIAGFSAIIIHYEAFPTEESMEEATSAIAKLGMKPVIAIKPKTEVSSLRYFGDTIDQFLLMSVEPGFQHNPFLEETFERLRNFRKLLPHAILEVDGGVSESNASALVAAGADLLVVGSALFETNDVAENFSKIEQAMLKT